jgi:predicted nucleic acid-binding protein
VTRYAIDADVLLRIAAGSLDVHPGHQLVAPASLRSQAEAKLYGAVQRGELERGTALEHLERVTEIKVRLLNDRVSRSVAWKIAEELGLESTQQAEFLAVTRLQADALVALDEELVRLADGVVPRAPLDALSSAASR